MAIPKKGSRSLVVDGQPYRWRLTGKINWNQMNQYGVEATLIIMVQAAEHAGSLLWVHYPCDLGGAYCEENDEDDDCCWRESRTGDNIEVTPQWVTDLIRMALAQGWKPQARAPKFCLNVVARP